MSTNIIITKRTEEEFAIGMDFTGKIPNNGVLASATIKAINQFTKIDCSSTVLKSTTGSVNPATNIATGEVKAGATSGEYLIRITIVTTNGSIISEEFILLLNS